ncbi:adenosylcobinamide-GDP ribazoletransferase [Bacillus sp. 03113]|uniref:adenosylcobinamide-GDP ribazoletransferase n=1 Tax=Bacillus sp. 03113 TaxID=2578211 RepID=UPI001142A251|nr:adenosylcobinamide-GDP ribazoletransferase [Bacillus sp. 03113]
MIWIKGLIINFQFFTSIPIPISISMDKNNVNGAIKTFPVLGFIQGIIYSFVFYVFIHWTPFSLLTAVFSVWLTMIILTGGIHLDGWIDTSDAFFAYQDKEKRLEIMKDPRTGAFGVLSVIVLLASKFFFVYEIGIQVEKQSYFFMMMIPILSKSIMGILLVRVQGAKSDGLGAYFKKSANKNVFKIYPLYGVFILILSAWMSVNALIGASILILAAMILYLIIARKAVKWFGGITGDVIGAAVEGTELLLWMTVWLLHYFVMG